MKTIILMLDALGDAPDESIKAAESQGYPFFRYVENPKPIKQTDHFLRIRDITASRNKSRQWILKQSFDRIALVDSDVVLPSLAVDKMAIVPHDFVGGWVPVRGSKNTRWIAGQIKDKKFENFETPSREFVESDMPPLACCLMSRKVFETIEVRAPNKNDRVTCGKTGLPMLPSEPFLFGFDLKSKFGLTCYLHPNIICKHLEN